MTPLRRQYNACISNSTFGFDSLRLEITTLKILGWVTLSCQFDSGPRHHFQLNPILKSIMPILDSCLKKRQMESIIVMGDATATPITRFILSQNSNLNSPGGICVSGT